MGGGQPLRTVGRWAVILLAAVACGGEEPPPAPGEPEPVGSPAPLEESETLTITSPAFEEGDTVPTEFTCEGDDTSPPLDWFGVPEDTAELQLTVTDPDAPGGTFTHWVVTGIDPASTGLAAGAIPEGGSEEENSSGETSYVGPCPPAGPAHTYVWTLEALGEDGTGLATASLTAEFAS